jgi:hypothetical protein
VADCGENPWDDGQQILQCIARGGDDNDEQRCAGKVLLVLEILIGGNEDLELRGRGPAQQLAILHTRPAFLLDRSDLMAGDVPRDPARQLLIEQNAHGPSAPRAQLRERRSLGRE